MIGIILAGGTGSRLYPLTKVTNKHLLPVCGKPMIYYPLQSLLDAGIKEIIIVTGREHMGDVMELLGSGKEFLADFTYKVQDEAGGIAQALGLCKNLVEEEETMAVILGDNIFLGETLDFKLDFPNGAKIFLKPVANPTRFGVATLGANGITSIIEKPKTTRSHLAVTGAYTYTGDALNIIKKLKPSERGELEITDLNNVFLRFGALQHKIYNGYWSDAGTLESLQMAQEHIWHNDPN